MLLLPKHLRGIIALGSLAILAEGNACHAGWMGFRNDSPSTLVIQETIGVGPVARSGKPQKLFANETIRDTPPATLATRQFQIFDSTKPDKPLFSGALTCPAANENVLFVIKSDGKGGLTIETTKLPIGGNRIPGAKADPTKPPSTIPSPEIPPIPKKDPPKKDPPKKGDPKKP